MTRLWWLHKKPHSASSHEPKHNSVFKCLCYWPSFAIHCDANKPVSCLSISLLAPNWYMRLIWAFLRILGADGHHKETVWAFKDSSQSKKKTCCGGVSLTIHTQKLHKELVCWTAIQTWDGERENWILPYFVALLLRFNRLDINQRLSLHRPAKLMTPHSVS